MVKTWRFALDYTAVDKIVRSSALMFHWLATLKLLCNGGLRKMSNVQILLTENWPQSENFKKYNRMNETRPWTFSMLQPAHWALLTHMRLMHCHMAVSIVMRAVDNACHQYISIWLGAVWSMTDACHAAHNRSTVNDDRTTGWPLTSVHHVMVSRAEKINSRTEATVGPLRGNAALEQVERFDITIAS